MLNQNDAAYCHRYGFPEQRIELLDCQVYRKTPKNSMQMLSPRRDQTGTPDKDCRLPSLDRPIHSGFPVELVGELHAVFLRGYDFFDFFQILVAGKAMKSIG